jgi:hypothetical protein
VPRCETDVPHRPSLLNHVPRAHGHTKIRGLMYYVHDMTKYVKLVCFTICLFLDNSIGNVKSSQVKCIMNTTEFGDVRYKPNGYFEGVTTGALKSHKLFQSRLSQYRIAQVASSCKLADFTVIPKSL